MTVLLFLTFYFVQKLGSERQPSAELAGVGAGWERGGRQRWLCSGLLIPDTDLGENPRRERGV
ncbi:hypothetical protein IPC856_18350 [Pseudomonas aeruginosa]|nr:hypothetical protein IPC856_18350 [Pseudomonas aeruginosa]